MTGDDAGLLRPCATAAYAGWLSWDDPEINPCGSGDFAGHPRLPRGSTSFWPDQHVANLPNPRPVVAWNVERRYHDRADFARCMCRELVRLLRKVIGPTIGTDTVPVPGSPSSSATARGRPGGSFSPRFRG